MPLKIALWAARAEPEINDKAMNIKSRFIINDWNSVSGVLNVLRSGRRGVTALRQDLPNLYKNLVPRGVFKEAVQVRVGYGVVETSEAAFLRDHVGGSNEPGPRGASQRRAHANAPDA